MDLLETLRSANSGAAVTSLAGRAGIDAAEAEAVLANVLPEFSRRIERNTLSRGGVADFVDLMGSADYEAVLDEPALAGQEPARAQGRAILGQIIGTKHGSRTIAAAAAGKTNVPAAAIEHMMPEIAMMVLGAMQRQTASQFGELTSQLPGSPPAEPGNFGDQSPLPVPGGLPQRDGWERDWQPGQPIPRADDLFPERGPLGGPNAPGDAGFGNQRPLPVPGGAAGEDWRAPQPGRNGRYRDLSDILRRRGGRLPNQGGGALGGLIRQILAQTLGFRNGGVMSWIIRFVLLRIAWPILRRMLFGR